MDNNKSTWIGGAVGSTVGSFIPLLWGASELSFSSLFFGAVGAIVGIYVAFKMSR
jgi:uncharacterized membrane protein YeaQ/YmgE (transglycosylase-associated protein family)